MEEDPNKPATYSSLFALLEMLSKSSLLLVGLAYISGFVIVNSYLSSFGITSFDLLKAKYIAAGVIFMLFLSLSGIILYPVVLFSSDMFSSRRPTSLKIGDAFWSAGLLILMQQLLLSIAPGTASHFMDKPLNLYLEIIMGTSVVFCIVTFFVSKLAYLQGPSYFLLMGVYSYRTFETGIIWVLINLLILAFVVGIFIPTVMDVTSRKKLLWAMTLPTMLVITALLVLFKNYAVYLYPKILNEYGDGKPVSMTLVFSKDETLGLELLFKNKPGSLETIEDVTLIDEDKDYFFIQKQPSPQDKTIRIKKSLVKALIHQKK